MLLRNWRYDCLKRGIVRSLMTSNSRNYPDVIGNYKYNPGEVYADFKCTQAERVPELNLNAYTFCHNRIGCQYTHLGRNDRENSFCISFRTPSFDSTGKLHVLQHLCLCGSDRFPFHDTFTKMDSRTVATYMNAIVGPDSTDYPFATTNKKDFRNLLEVYLDAVFKPKLNPFDFGQKAWRLENTDSIDSKSELTIKGFVYNLMKGNFAENTSIFAWKLMNSLLPDHTYAHIYAGHPFEIPKLTHSQVVEYHKKFYHPSNAHFCSYGSFDLMETLAYINEAYLCHYDPIDSSFSQVASQEPWKQPREEHITCGYKALGAEFEQQNHIAVGLLMCDVRNHYETFVLDILNQLLIDGPSAWFYKSLIEPNFSGGFQQSTGYDKKARDTLYCIGLQDIKCEDFPRFLDAYSTTINEILEQGFDREHIESILHREELYYKGRSKLAMPLTLLAAAMSLHDGDIVQLLRRNDTVRQFRNSLLKDPRYLQKKVECYFKENQHRLTLTMSPDKDYYEKFCEAERMLVGNITKKMSQDERKAIIRRRSSLKDLQRAPSDEKKVLPTLTLADVQDPPLRHKIHQTYLNSVPTSIVTAPTNQIVYFRSHFNVSGFSLHDIHLLPLLCHVLTNVGTESHDACSFNTMVNAKTGGFRFNTDVSEKLQDPSQYNVGMMMRSEAVDPNVDELYSLACELLTKFSLKAVEWLLKKYLSDFYICLIKQAVEHALQSAFGILTEAQMLKCQMSSFQHVKMMKKLVISLSPAEIHCQLTKLADKTFNANNMKASIVADFIDPPVLMNKYERFLKKLPSATTRYSIQSRKSQPRESKCIHYIMNIPINHCAKTLLTVPYTHPDHPKLKILANILTTYYLTPVIRERNGAAQVGANIKENGIFYFFSSCDPNNRKTLDIFDNTYDWLICNSDKLSEERLLQAKLSILRSTDAPIAPKDLGLWEFRYDASEELSIQYRQVVLDVTVDDVRYVIEKYFANAPEIYGKFIMGPKDEKLGRERPGECWMVFGPDLNILVE